MADTKTTALTENTSPLTTDILYLVDDPAGTPASQKVSILNLLNTPSTAVDIYIDDGGSDVTGDGSSGNPYATLAKALSYLPNTLYANATIHVADGTYAEPITLRRFRCQPNVLLKITGNTSTPANVNFTGTVNNDDGNAVGCLVTGHVNAEIEGIKINVTAVNGVHILNNAILVIDRCVITGTISSRGVQSSFFSLMYLRGNITVSGWAVDGIGLFNHSICRFDTAGTLTVTGPGTSGNGVHIYGHSIFTCNAQSGLNITITGVQYGFQLGLNALFQHVTATGTITIDNSSKPSSSAGVQCTDLSSWSTNQSAVIDNFTDAFEANSISYIEAIGSRTVTNCTNTSDATQNSVIYLP